MGEQKRHWLLTVHDEHLKKWTAVRFDRAKIEPDFAQWDYIASIEQAFASCKSVRYACGQLERGEEGTLHYQLYVEFSESLRLAQVIKLFPSHAESRLGTRTDAREYCTSEVYRGKSKGKVGDHFEVGHWRQDTEGRTESQKTRILRYICQEGLMPNDIAVRDPEAFFSHYRSIRALYAARQGQEWWG